MRSRFAILLAIAVVCVATAWAGFAPEEQITTSRAAKDLRMYNGRKVVIASNGVRHLVWNDGSAIYYNRYYPQSGWTADYKLSGNTRNCRMPAIALDPNGTDIHVVWDDWDDIYYQKCVPGPSGNGGWLPLPVNITRVDKTKTFVTPSIACYKDAAGVHHIVVTWCVWTGPIAVGFCECVDGTWGQPTLIAGPSASAIPWYPSIAADPLARCGEAFIATQTGTGGVYAKRRSNGVWQAWENVPGPGAGPCFIDVDPATGSPHIVCNTYDKGVYHTFWDPTAGWMPFEMMSSTGAISNGPPGMCFSNGSAFIVWSETTSTAGGVRYAIGQHGMWTSDWLTHRYYQGDFDYVSSGASTTGDVYTVYMDEAGRYRQLFGTLYTPGGGGPQAAPVAMTQGNVELVPNPAKAGRVTVHYALAHDGPMTVTLIDVSGRAVRTPEVAATNRSGSFSIDARGLRAGVYILKLDSGSGNLTRKLVIN